MPICQDTEIAYDRAGPTGGLPLVLLHAGIADRRMWDPTLPALTVDHDVVRLDLRGFGESTSAPNAHWSPRADVLATLDALGIDRAHLIGGSFGAGVAVEVALERPAAAASLVLAAPGGALITERTADLLAFWEAEGKAAEAGDFDAAAEANVVAWVDGPHRGPDVVRAEVRDAVREMQRLVFEIGETWDWDAVEKLEDELNPPASERYAELAAPTLVVSGALDIDAIGKAADGLVAGVPDVQGVCLARRGPRALDGAARRLRRAGARLGGRAFLTGAESASACLQPAVGIVWPMTIPRTAAVLAVAGSAVAAILTTSAATTSVSAPTGNPDPGQFKHPQDNPFFPLTSGLVTRLRGTDDDERFSETVKVTNRTRTIIGVEATVFRDVVRRPDGSIAEATDDWYAADNDGNVWYLGEDTATYDENGNLESREGSWEAGVHGAEAGIIMPADPQPGDADRMEFDKGNAEDQAWVVQRLPFVDTLGGRYDDIVRTFEWSRLEPKVISMKFYARGLGIVEERDVAGGNEHFWLVSSHK